MLNLEQKLNYNPDVLSCLANLSSDEVFTSPKLANEILDLLPEDIWQDEKATFLDPATKSGIFLREITKRLLQGLEDKIPNLQERINHILTKQVFGIGITELTALISRRSLYCSKTANGKYSICNVFDNEEGNIVYNNIEHTWNNGKCIYCGTNTKELGEREELETHAYEFIHTDKPEIIFNMKFDVIIGNPPYQLNDGGSKASASPIYQKFVKQAKKLNPRFLTMIIPSRWFAGGKGLDEFREDMLNDKQLRLINDFINAKECFPGASIGGGVCYFLWEKEYEGKCKVTNTLNGNSNTALRDMNEFPIFVRQNKAINIINKVFKGKPDTLSRLVSSRNPFGLASSKRGKKNNLLNSVALHSSEGISYIDNKEVLKGKDKINKFKVMLSKVIAEHAGEPDKMGKMRIISRMEVLSHNEVCTDSYLIIGGFDSENIAINLYKYLRTYFSRFLLMQAVTSINLSKDKFFFVPMQDFNEEWTDEKLYKKYGLDEKEIEFIEKMVRPME